jgi:hypothetical protein
MNRRRFFRSSLSAWVFQTRPGALKVAVMETFLDSAGPSAVMVHHATEATRSAFAAWLRANSGASIICTLPDGRRIGARIFRLNGCFGRGLILTREIIDVQAKDVLAVD